MNNESSSKFISALVKALQTLCHGYIEFNDGIEIIGHIYLNIDSGSSFDYVVKEKLCKSTENSTVFVSKSFQAQAPLDECLTRKDKNDHATEFDDAPDMSPTTGTTRIASAITSISNVLSGAQDSQKSRLLDHSSLHPLPQNTGKRKRDHNGSYGNLQPPVKYTTLQASSSSSSPYFSSEPSSKLPADRNHSEHFHASAHGEFFGADSNQSSGMGADEEDDLHLDVTFVKEEYQRNSSHRGAPASAASRLNQDLSSNHSHMLHDGTSGVGALGYSSGHHQGSHFASGTAGDIASINDSFHDTSQVDIGHNAAQGPPNPRSEMDDGACHAFRVPAMSMKYFKCPVCSIIIQHKNNILRHMRQHNASMTLQDPSSANRQVTTPSPEGSAFDLSATSHFSSQSFPRQKGIELVHTLRQTKWAVARAREWLSLHGMNIQFEQFSDEQIDQMLMGFYTSGQKKDGAPFSATALLAFRTAVNRYLNNKCGRQISIATSHCFKQSNALLSRLMSTSIKINKSISAQDIKLMYTSGALSNSNPEALLYKVWFELQMHFRSKIDWSKVHAEHFFFSHNQAGKLTVTWNTCGLGTCTQMTVFEATGGRFCSVESLRIYMEHHNHAYKMFLQIPASKDLQSKGIWYLPEEIRDYRERGFMKKISSHAKLSQAYTNACVLNSIEDYHQKFLIIATEPLTYARNDATAGPPLRMPEGVKPLCGYVHPDDVKKWMMYDLMPGSSVYIHQENYNVVLSKTRQDRPDGKAMARYLMSCFWRQSELVGASIAEPPKPHQRSLDRSIVHAILGFCQHHSHESPTDIRRTLQQKIGYAKFYFVKKTLDPDSPKTTPASISVEASPRRMSMEMARRGAGRLPLEFPLKVHTGEFKGRRVSGTFSRGLSERDDGTTCLPPRGMPDLSASNYSEIANDLSNRLSGESGRQTMSTPADIISDKLPADVANRLPLSGLAKKISAEMGSRISGDFSGRISADPSSRLPDDLSTRSLAGLSDRSTDLSSNRMPTERVVSTTLDILSGRTPETSLSELANRIGSVPGGMSRGFLDMLNNIYPNN